VLSSSSDCDYEKGILKHLNKLSNSMELKKLIIAKLVREPTPFGNPEGLLLYSQQPATSHYPEPDESSPRN
jgi:hypothetical protein